MDTVKQSEIAKHFNVSRQAVHAWFSKKVPASRVLELEKISGIPRSNLRPDIYPPNEYSQLNYCKSAA